MIKSNGIFGINPTDGMKPDEQGNYPLTLAVLNKDNMDGRFMPSIAESTLQTFGASFPARNVLTLRKPRKTGATAEELAHDHETIDMKEECGHIADIHLVEQTDGTQLIVGKVKPAGPHEVMLRGMLAQPGGEVRIGMRSLVRAKESGRVHRDFVIEEIISFDLVI